VSNQVRSQVRNQVETQVINQVWTKVFNQVSNVRNQIIQAALHKNNI